MKKSILTKTVTVATLAVAGIATVNANKTARATIVQNDASVYTTDETMTVYNSYENGQVTGQILPTNTSWKIIRTAYDNQGNKWYDLGKNQWVKVPKEIKTTTSLSTATTNAQSQSTTAHSKAASTSSNYTSSATGSEAEAKAWIANHESGGSYSARNGQFIGKYQLSASYLHGDYSAANQEKTADQYVKDRYGSWTAAKSFWQANGWY